VTQSSRFALGVEYAGGRYDGWQTQPSGRGVQDVLEAAVSSVAGEAVGVVAAGRTDAGVHASLQVVHVDTTAMRPLQAWVRGVNAGLPDDIAVRWAKPVASEFHARFSARSRSYTYLLLNRSARPGLASGRVGWFHTPLDVEAMRSAAAVLLGEHDFSAFRAAGCQAKTPVRMLTRCEVTGRDEMLRFELQANAFLHRMVRNIVGCLVYVGAGRQPPRWMAELLASRDRALAAPTFAPDGLYLTGVAYDAQWGLPECERPVSLT
jgi:tRNA pseudouridine38-40 synthase